MIVETSSTCNLIFLAAEFGIAVSDKPIFTNFTQSYISSIIRKFFTVFLCSNVSTIATVHVLAFCATFPFASVSKKLESVFTLYTVVDCARRTLAVCISNICTNSTIIKFTVCTAVVAREVITSGTRNTYICGIDCLHFSAVYESANISIASNVSNRVMFAFFATDITDR